MKQKRKAKKGYMTLKLEQRLIIEWEWLFVGYIMKRIGLHTKWIKLIMEGLTKLSYSVLKIREPKGFIRSSRDQ